MEIQRKKSNAAFSGAVVLVLVPVLYVASFGPACWAVDRDWLPVERTAMLYRPLLLLSADSPVATSLWWYATIGCAHGLGPRAMYGAVYKPDYF